jgi:hypothetical protein
MNPLTDFIFTVTWFALFVFAIRSLIKGWSLMREVPAQGYIVEKKTVTKVPHPEMVDVQHGDELLVVKFSGEEPKDPLLESLQNRIDEIEDPWDNEDENDGGLVVRK